jgi:hypothetical protein
MAARSARLPAAARTALRRVQLAVHPDKHRDAAAREANTRSLALLNAYVDALQRPDGRRLREAQLHFVLAADDNCGGGGGGGGAATTTASAAARRASREVRCTLPASGTLQPLFSAFADILGADGAAFCSASASAGAEGAPAGAHDPELVDLLAWLRSAAGSAAAARAAHEAHVEALRVATEAVKREFRLPALHVCCTANVDGSATPAHLAALAAALRGVPAGDLRDLRGLRVFLDTSERLPMSLFASQGAAASSKDEDRAGRSFVLLNEGILYLSLSTDASAYAAMLAAVAASLGGVARAAAAAAEEAAVRRAACQRAAAALGVFLVYGENCSTTDLTWPQLRAFCAAVCAAVMPRQSRRLLGSFSVRVERFIPTQPADCPTEGDYALKWACPQDGALRIAVRANEASTLIIAFDVPPAALASFLAEHGARLAALAAEQRAHHARRGNAEEAARAALGFRRVSSSYALPVDAALASLGRLKDAAPEVVDALRSSGTTTGIAMPAWWGDGASTRSKLALLIEQDGDSEAYIVRRDGTLVVPASFAVQRLLQALLGVSCGSEAAAAAAPPKLPATKKKKGAGERSSERSSSRKKRAAAKDRRGAPPVSGTAIDADDVSAHHVPRRSWPWWSGGGSGCCVS